MEKKEQKHELIEKMERNFDYITKNPLRKKKLI